MNETIKSRTVSYRDWIENEYKKDPDLKRRVAVERRKFEIAETILIAREKAKLTQAQLAELISTSQPAIARLESADYSRPSYRTLEKIAEALGLELEITLKAPKPPRKTTKRKQATVSAEPT